MGGLGGALGEGVEGMIAPPPPLPGASLFGMIGPGRGGGVGVRGGCLGEDVMCVFSVDVAAAMEPEM